MPFYRGVPGRTGVDGSDDELPPRDSSLSGEEDQPRLEISELSRSIQQAQSDARVLTTQVPQDLGPPPPPELHAQTSARLGALRAGLKTINSGRSLSSHSHSHASSRNLRATAPPAPNMVSVGGRSSSGGSGGLALFRRVQAARSAPTGLFRKTSAGSSGNGNSLSSKGALFASKFALRSNARSPSGSGDESSSLDFIVDDSPHGIRRYKVDDDVLVYNQQSRWANLVNKHGFPPNEGDTPEERRGPYKYVLATVKKVHFEEIKAYYTVTRRDTGADQRADTEYMEPIRTSKGRMAALKAATSSVPVSPIDQDRNDACGGDNGFYTGNKCLDCIQILCFVLLIPFFWLFDFLRYVGVFYIQPCYSAIMRFVRHHAILILNGLDPYSCHLKVTCVNFVVVCSTWYMFIDQARLAFFPPAADYAVAVINLVIWIVLVLELVFELFVRPDGYFALLSSEKAFTVDTVRYLSCFHLVVETISLLLFIPEFYCILDSATSCDDRLPFSFYNAALMGVIGPTRLNVFYGRAYFALVRLRVVGMVRHWKNMWVSNTFITMKWKSKQTNWLSSIVPSHSSPISKTGSFKKAEDPEVVEQKKREAALTNASTIGTALMVTNSYRALGILWVIMGVFPVVFSILSTTTNPVAFEMTYQLQATNLVAADNLVPTCEYLSASVFAWVTGLTPPDFLNDPEPYLLTLDIMPERCEFQQLTNSSINKLCDELEDGTFAGKITTTETERLSVIAGMCDYWQSLSGSSSDEIAHSAGIRAGSIVMYQVTNNQTFMNITAAMISEEEFSVEASFDATYSITTAAYGSLLLQLCLLIAVLGGLSVLRHDAEVLVLGPLRRMLKRVARYAKNPLMPPKLKRRSSSVRRKNSSGRRGIHDSDDLDSSSDSSTDYDGDDSDLGLGSYETEQLITAVNKITDLLRKCWGVAGADIISTNLATREGALTEVRGFNPTVPGKSVYALFGFACINQFDHVLRELRDDVMILINDVAAVLHGEVFRWGFGDSGQCNKNLGSAFLMVFRIGLVKEVIEKLEQATDVVFSTGTNKTTSLSNSRRRHNRQSSLNTQSSAKSSGSSTSAAPSATSSASISKARSMARRKSQKAGAVNPMSLSLQSLPGIATFTDRAVIGMLKSFAGIYRDKKILEWNNDFRLGQGVGVFTVSMIFGMDAGWAVEGAVGSEYKIDATYLSPHVNMASRMMAACKQYNVNIMLSQAVQELMSDVARTKLRHLDTVTVKGSSVRQRIYTYDARPKGVDFFLYSRSDEQADFDAENYSPQIWNNDQDLKAMRQHVTEDFIQAFSAGRKAYLQGDWPKALQKLERANEIMVETALEEGYLEDEFDALQERVGQDAKAAEEELKRENGDGPSLLLINFMKSHGGVAPKGWDGWHPLTRK